MKHAERLRSVCADIRRKPYPISDVVPVMQAAADAIDTMQSALDDAVAKLAARDAEISAVRAGLHELIAKLAARDAEVERLKFDLLSLIQANAVLSKALSEEVKGGE